MHAEEALHRVGRGGRPAVVLPPTPLDRWLRHVPAARSDDGWVAYELGDALVAGPPARRLLDDPWGDGRLPDSLWAVYGVHDGIGPVGVPRSPFGSPRLAPVREVAPLTRWMRFGEEGILYRPAEWLRFTVDAQGGWCVSEDGEIRWWCMTDHTLSAAGSLEEVWEGLAGAWKRGGHG